MKIFLGLAAVSAASALFAAGVPNERVVNFSTKGPDRYADGSTVADGECYALVWSADGVFEGIGADGKAKGAGDKVVYIGAFAEDGRCPLVSFRLAEGAYEGGRFALWLLDTRVFDNGVVTKVGKKSGVVTSAAPAVEGSVAVVATGTPQTAEGPAGGVAAVQPTVDRADVPAPKITMMSFDRDAEGRELVVLEMSGTVPGVGYVGVGAATPTMEGAKEGGLTTGLSGKVRVVVPKTGDKGFFQGIVK